jgi:hypothetical protein
MGYKIEIRLLATIEIIEAFKQTKNQRKLQFPLYVPAAHLMGSQ